MSEDRQLQGCPNQATEDPVVTSSRREAAAAVVMWAIAMTYTVGYCYLFGYRRPPEDLRFIFGIPDWVLWGIFAPWLVWTVVSALFAKFVMRDADLSEEEPSGDLPGQTPPAEASHG
jgi:uncharacterized membrane protein YhdT